jgi:DNA invertase Pin-like site-specific DNA recombinase
MDNNSNQILREILVWLRLQGIYLLETSLLPSLLDSEDKKKVYQMTDGNLSVNEISKRTSVSVGSISNWWNQWYERGILLKEGKRYKKLISLRTFTPKKEADKDG